MSNPLTQVKSAIAAAFGEGSVPSKGVDRTLFARANEGQGEAQFSLGSLYENGDGGQQGFAQAAIWYRKAAAQGVPRAQR